MKKLLTLTMIAAVLMMASCVKEPEQKEALGGTAKVTYTVSGPETIATKAMGQIGTTYTLYYEVRLWDGVNLGNKLEGTGLSGSKEVASDAWPANIELDLARNQQYKILFWAQSSEAPEGLFTIGAENGLKSVAIDYANMAANNEACDAFSGFDVITPAGASAVAVTLTRPFALVNLGASDADQFHTASGGLTVGNTSVTLTGKLGKTFNVATGAATAYAESATIGAAPIDAYDVATLTAGGNTYNYLHAVYVLPYEEMVNVAYAIQDNAENGITELSVTNVPVKPNYRTNITGKILTGTTVYSINVDQAFAADMDKPLGKSFASVADLNAYFAAFAAAPYNNGIAQPEEVTLTAISGENPTITLPAIASDVVIRIPNAYDGTLTIAYAATGDKPANLSLQAKNLKKLVANITSTHFTLLSGSWITDQAEVFTSSTTFVIQKGAKVGTVTVSQGNAEIAGEVEKVVVDDDASADGAGAPVQVFLTSESAVKQIELNAKTDVVVEQPKDNINEGNTENKVEVLVKAEAEGSSAKAQNGGAIYVKAEGDCLVISDGADENNNKSNVTVAVATANVVATTVDEGQVVVKDAAEPNTSVTANGVAMIGNTVYSSLADAIATVPVATPTTITMIADVELTAGITIGADYSVILELNGQTISETLSKSGTSALITNNGTLVIQDKTDAAKNGTGKGKIKYCNAVPDPASIPGYASNTIINQGNLTIESGYLENTTSGGYAAYTVDNITNGGLYTPTFTMNGGKLYNNYTDAVRMFLNSTTNLNKVVINGGVLDSDKASGRVVVMHMPSAALGLGELDITGGTIDGKVNAWSNANAGGVEDRFSDAQYAGVKISITGGTMGSLDFESMANLELRKESLLVAGGTFAVNPSAYVNEGYEVVEGTDGLWTVVSNPGYIFENDVVTIYAAHGLSYVSKNYADFRDADHNLTIKLSEDINMTGRPFSSFNVNNYTSEQKDLVLFTFDGQNHTITGMEKMLIATTWAGKSAADVKNLTIKDANIVEDENDSSETTGVGAICGWPQASQYFYITNVHIINSTIIGGHWTGGLIGIASGYDNPTDGPVKEGIIVTNCSVEGCTIKGKGSAGSLVGHAAANEATTWEITNFSAVNNIIDNTGTKTDRTGALIGTLGTTKGVSTAYPDAKVGVYFTSPLVVSGNKVLGELNDTRKVGRKGSYEENKVFLDDVNVVDEWLGSSSN